MKRRSKRQIENDSSGTVSTPGRKAGKADPALTVIRGRPTSLNFFEISRKTISSEILDAWNDSIASFIRRPMEFIERAARLRGHARIRDFWLVETKFEACGESGR